MSDDYRNRRFRNIDFSGASFRDVDFSGVKMIEALLVNTEISGLIIGLKVNGVEVAPLISNELDRLHPERVQLRATDPVGVRAAWTLVEEMWQPTMERAARLTEHERQTSVDEEWSFVDTLRHLIFVTDAWFGRTVLAETDPYDPLGLPPTFLGDVGWLGIDVASTPSFAAVAAVRRHRMSSVRHAIATMEQHDLDRVCAPNPAPGYPPDTSHRVIDCLHTVMDEEWAHHQYAIRDLAEVERRR